ncbi:reverse transcriptase domain-containing protein [Tanacetum coccineum]
MVAETLNESLPNKPMVAKGIKVAIHHEYPKQTVTIGERLSEKGKMELCDLLRSNLDIFAWKPSDMTSVPRSIAEHCLNVREGRPPIRQKRRGHAPDRNKAIQEEVTKLLEAQILREVHYHNWLSNAVMVKKHDDAYKGYHQIHMAEEDEEKTAFHISQGVFFYTKMPFVLNHARATYHRLVDKSFEKQIGRNLEVYVDDPMIKIHAEQEILRDVEETFQTLRKINMKLNPKKSTFGAKEGMFLGHVINMKGIKACPDKAEMVIKLQSSRSLKETKDIDPGEDGPLIEIQVEEAVTDPWTLFTDVASCLEGSGAKLILTNPEGVEFTYPLRVQNLEEKVDSRLVANQINGSYVAKEQSMIQYLEKAKMLISGFIKLSIEQVPQSENKKAFALSKIASTSFTHLTKQVLVKVLKEKSIKEREVLAVVERANRSLGEGIKARLGEENKNGVEEVPHVMWAHRTTIKTSNGHTSFSLTYNTEAVIPFKIGIPSLRYATIDQAMNDEVLLLNLDILKEEREKSASQEKKSKAKMEKYYNAKVRSTTFKPGDFVYRSNEANHAKEGRKLGPKWEGPYEVVEALWKGSYKIRNDNGDILPLTWNVKDLKKCYL